MLKQSFYNYWPFILGLFLGIYFISLNVVGKTLLYLPGDYGDTRLNLYILEHFYQFILGRVDSYWNAPFMFPAPNVITFSTNLLGVAPLFAVFRGLGFDLETSFQLWYLVIVILNYSCTYIFLKYVIKNKYAAIIGAMIFTFSMALQGQMAHAQTFARFCIPIVFLYAMLFAEKFKVKYFFIMCVAFVYQVYCGLYLGMLVLIPLFVFFIVSILIQHKKYWKHVKNMKWVSLVFAGLVFNVAWLLYLLKPYMLRADKIGYTGWEFVKENIPRFESYFYSQPGSFLWSILQSTGDHIPRHYNHYLFAGGLSVLLTGCYIFIASKKIALNKNSFHKLMAKPIGILSITALSTFVLFLRVGDFTLYNIIYSLPGYGSIRAVPRIINVELLFVAMAAAYVLLKVFSGMKKYAPIVFILIASLFIVDNYYSLEGKARMSKLMMQERTSQMRSKLAHLPMGSVFSYEPDSTSLPIHVYHLDAMLAAQALQLKTFNGYTGNIPYGYGPYSYEPNAENRLKWIQKSLFNEEVVIVK